MRRHIRLGVVGGALALLCLPGLIHAQTCPDPQKIVGDVRLTRAEDESLRPSLAWTGSEFGTSWLDYRDAGWEIYFARISATGAKIGSDVRITLAANTSSYPSLVW